MPGGFATFERVAIQHGPKMPTLEQLVQIGTLVGVFLTLCTLAAGLYEYARQTALKRAELFSLLHDRLKSDDMSEICTLLESDDVALQTLDYGRKVKFLGLYEEIALAMNSGLIQRRVAHYMFSYYAIRCWESVNFWHLLNRDS